MLLANFLELTLRAFYFVYPKCQRPCSTGIGCLRHFLTATESPEENYLEKRDGGGLRKKLSLFASRKLLVKINVRALK